MARQCAAEAVVVGGSASNGIVLERNQSRLVGRVLRLRIGLAAAIRRLAALRAEVLADGFLNNTH